MPRYHHNDQHPRLMGEPEVVAVYSAEQVHNMLSGEGHHSRGGNTYKRRQALQRRLDWLQRPGDRRSESGWSYERVEIDALLWALANLPRTLGPQPEYQI